MNVIIMNMRCLYVKKAKGFASFYALIIFLVVVSYTYVLSYQIRTYQKTMNQKSLLHLYALRSVCVFYYNQTQQLPIYEQYLGYSFKFDKIDQTYYVYYDDTILEAYFNEDKLINYEYH